MLRICRYPEDGAWWIVFSVNRENVFDNTHGYDRESALNMEHKKNVILRFGKCSIPIAGVSGPCAKRDRWICAPDDHESSVGREHRIDRIETAKTFAW